MTFDLNDPGTYFSSNAKQKAKKLLESRSVRNFTYNDDGVAAADIKDDHTYKVVFFVDENGKVSSPRCSCGYGYYMGCRHIAAVAMIAKAEFKRRQALSDKSSRSIGRLISEYTNAAVAEEAVVSSAEPVRLVPSLDTSGILSYELTIGRERQYVVKDINELYNRFRSHSTHSYGKFFTFDHNIEALDEKSRKLLDLSVLIYSTSHDYWGGRRNFNLENENIEKFFELFDGDELDIDKRTCRIALDDPSVTFTIERSTNDRFIISADRRYELIGKGRRGLFLNEEEHRLYAASPKFTRAVYELYAECLRAEEGLYIAKNDMPPFYTAVLKRVKDLAEVRGLEDLDEYVPPELTPKLYVDLGKDNEVIGRLDFCYGDKVFHSKPAPSDEPNPYSDKTAEQIAIRQVGEYFDTVTHRWVNYLSITDEDRIMRFITEGLPKLTEVMEVYASERFKRISNRPPVKPVVGVRPGGSLLLVNISDENYTNEELVEILGAYRRGAKYHRLKNGSFAMINDSVAELEEFTKNLNISDKQLLKENLNVPKYRMMYLDSLKRSENFRLQRSEEFRRAVRKYRSDLEGTEATEVPRSLEDIMRDYQRYGFRWLKTLSLYGFGGILADDMGLGKTLQAIALMLDAKERSETHIQSFVVCPATLTLNWENEIRRFAPELKAVTVIGTVAVREQLFEQLDEYDVVITSYSTLTRDIGRYEGRKFYLHFIDEAQYIKNHGTQMAKAVKAIDSQIRFALTGTPVENSLAELWSIFDFVMPDYLFNYNRFKKNFETPIVSKKDEAAVTALQRSVSPFILRRMKKEVLTELPDKTETVLTSMMEPEQRKLYTANAELLRQSLGNSGNSPEERIKILAMLTRLRQLCCDPHLVYEDFKGGSAKLEQCIELVESCINSGHKILLFSQFTSMLDIIRRRLEENGTAYYILTGETKPKDRIRMMNEFNADSTPVFLISLKAGGTGLNLTGADIVIHYDPWWNVSAENQASDRVYRIGQRNNVQVYKLVADKSIEQNIIKLQEAKKELGELVVNGDGDIMHMSADDIMSLL